MKRTKPPERPLNEFTETRHERNEKILRSTKASNDPKLDGEAYAKTMAEVERGVLKGPFESLEEILLDDIALVPRHGIWEQHGGATEASCRCIDDMLVGEQNGTVGTVSSHRPTDPDGLVAQVGAVRRRYPKLKLLGWPCDLEKAYKQVPQDPRQIKWTIIVIWSPLAMKPVFLMAPCQLFGGKSPPLNFARYPAWLCECASTLFALPITHCVDDVIGIEPASLALAGNIAFKLLCEATG